MNLHKTEWLESVRHIHAQDAAWFVGFLLVVLLAVLWHDAWKEIKEDRKREEKNRERK